MVVREDGGKFSYIPGSKAGIITGVSFAVHIVPTLEAPDPPDGSALGAGYNDMSVSDGALLRKTGG